MLVVELHQVFGHAISIELLLIVGDKAVDELLPARIARQGCRSSSREFARFDRLVASCTVSRAPINSINERISASLAGSIRFFPCAPPRTCCAASTEPCEDPWMAIKKRSHIDKCQHQKRLHERASFRTAFVFNCTSILENRADDRIDPTKDRHSPKTTVRLATTPWFSDPCK